MSTTLAIMAAVAPAYVELPAEVSNCQYTRKRPHKVKGRDEAGWLDDRAGDILTSVNCVHRGKIRADRHDYHGKGEGQ